MRSALHDLLEPLFLTTLTTAIGMLSLVLSRVAAIREFGWIAAFGVTILTLLGYALKLAAETRALRAEISRARPNGG